MLFVPAEAAAAAALEYLERLKVKPWLEECSRQLQGQLEERDSNLESGLSRLPAFNEKIPSLLQLLLLLLQLNNLVSVAP